MTRLWISAFVVLAVSARVASACGGPYGVDVRNVLSPEARIANRAEEQLRAAGAEGMAALANLRARLTNPSQQSQAASPERLQSQLQRLDEVMDRVGGAKYCSRSGLFWHTDFAQAQAVAGRSGKPILSLRLMGNLTDEYSCANSRFFRTTLYANADVSQFLRENFVLHWKSVRPVPVVTIDFGDGRKLQRTLTGNSIHYVLTPEGEVVDALPGLYGPKAFQKHLGNALSAAASVAKLEPPQRVEALTTYHTERLAELQAAWAADIRRLEEQTVLSGRPETGGRGFYASAEAGPPSPVVANGAQPDALRAAATAEPKGRVEKKLISEVAPVAISPMELEDDQTWLQIAALHQAEAELDQATLALIRSQNPTAAQAGRLAFTKRLAEDPLVRMVRSFQNSIALDTVKNEYQLHRALHQWLLDPGSRTDVDALNERVYAELFLTPRSDPWLGLAPADVYTALPNGGVGPTAATTIAE